MSNLCGQLLMVVLVVFAPRFVVLCKGDLYMNLLYVSAIFSFTLFLGDAF